MAFTCWCGKAKSWSASVPKCRACPDCGTALFDEAFGRAKTQPAAHEFDGEGDQAACKFCDRTPDEAKREDARLRASRGAEKRRAEEE